MQKRTGKLQNSSSHISERKTLQSRCRTVIGIYIWSLEKVETVVFSIHKYHSADVFWGNHFLHSFTVLRSLVKRQYRNIGQFCTIRIVIGLCPQLIFRAWWLFLERPSMHRLIVPLHLVCGNISLKFPFLYSSAPWEIPVPAAKDLIAQPGSPLHQEEDAEAVGTEAFKLSFAAGDALYHPSFHLFDHLYFLVLRSMVRAPNERRRQSTLCTPRCLRQTFISWSRLQ